MRALVISGGVCLMLAAIASMVLVAPYFINTTDGVSMGGLFAGIGLVAVLVLGMWLIWGDRK